MGSKVKVVLVTLKQPCTACLITGNLIKEMLQKMKSDRFYVEYIELDDLKDVHKIEGLEVESFPAILINDEQVTAGSLPDRKSLEAMIDMEAKADEKH